MIWIFGHVGCIIRDCGSPTRDERLLQNQGRTVTQQHLASPETRCNQRLETRTFFKICIIVWNFLLANAWELVDNRFLFNPGHMYTPSNMLLEK